MNKTIPVFTILIFFNLLIADSLSVIMVGDIMMGSDYPGNNLTPKPECIFQEVSAYLNDADLTLGNHEGTLSEGGICTKKIEKGKCYAFRTPPAYVSYLVDAGFDGMNLANNHMNDFGAGGIESTIKALTDAGLKYCGAYSRIARIDIRGTTVAVMSFATSPNADMIFEIEKAQEFVADVARENDIVIVSFHGGGEGVKYLHTADTFEYYMGWPRGNVVKFAHAVIDSGADCVWGHGPHVPRALEIYKDRMIAYSLGNFFTWGFNLGDERGYAPILKVTMDTVGTFMHGQIISALQRTYQYLQYDSLARAAKLMQGLCEDDFPETCPLINDQGYILPRPKVLDQGD
ncbi:hypothetical protein A2Y85_03030 [candidate division WOR-3 bacterium RBG_13_43_14]|uniref:Capsule synthesis protein CapA domain-containing protein n=1 Tax=candidate division WOR-3 bacterium RBG_13_43_14 TaxID=1802590 RepID=A0A1F4UBJ7_UNCW3|nr:MAG: hypothetical protein A2Y85_03030 [candidate division WOR-3 bacterium RBG_13_43_14]